jgi:hypothetical protein
VFARVNRRLVWLHESSMRSLASLPGCPETVYFLGLQRDDGKGGCRLGHLRYIPRILTKRGRRPRKKEGEKPASPAADVVPRAAPPSVGRGWRYPKYRPPPEGMSGVSLTQKLAAGQRAAAIAGRKNTKASGPRASAAHRWNWIRMKRQYRSWAPTAGGKKPDTASAATSHGLVSAYN